MNDGERVRQLRERKGLRPIDVVNRTGLSKSFYSEFEDGKKNCKVKTLKKICKVLGVTMGEFFEDETETMPENESVRIVKESQVTPERLKKALKIIDLIDDNQD